MKSKRLKANTVVSQVIEEIRQLIASGRYGVNDKLPSEPQLAETFGVGLSTIREAIKVFNHLGILESRPAKGTFVSDRTEISKEALTWSILLGKDDIRDMIDFRKAIELECMLTLQERVRSGEQEAVEAVKKLKKRLEAMSGALESDDELAYLNEDFDFHQTIVNGRGNPLLYSIFETLRSFIRTEMEKTRPFGRRYAEVHREHQEIVRAIEMGTIGELVDVVTRHFESIKTSMGPLIKDAKPEVPNPA